MQRILIVGPCGAGKSTLAVRLGQLLELPVIHLDTLNWLPGWVVASPEQFKKRLDRALAGERWIIDGNYGDSLTTRIVRADTVIFLDLPRWRCMFQVLKRIARHAGQTRPDMGADCPEKLDWEFLEYVWNFHDDSRPRLLRRIAARPRETRLIVLWSPSEVNAFVEELSGGSG